MEEQKGKAMWDDVIETVVEIAVDVAEAVITDKAEKKRNASRSCDAGTEQTAAGGN